MKRKKIAVVDRISDLPESLLCHILSFLPTKESVATSILSTRWKLLWTLVPKLDLDSDEITASELLRGDEYLREIQIKFAHVVSSVLAQQERGELRTFRLRWKFWWDGSHLDAWLRTAAARKVKELDLHIYTDGENLKLPPSFLSCTTLVVLKLSDTIALDIDTPSLSFNFPSLKKLLVATLMPSNSQEYSFLKLLSGCPVLEDLSLTTELFEREYKICVPTLKRLSIHDFHYDYDYELKINAPALEYLDFFGDLRDIKFYEKLNNLVRADVYIAILDSVPEEFRRKWVSNLFAALNNVKLLSFSPRGPVWNNFENIYPSSFQNLVQLVFVVNGQNWNVLPDLLQKAPNLETLFITTDYGIVKTNLYRKEAQYNPDNLSSLTSFYFRDFWDEKDEVELVKYVLKEARVLKTATIEVSHEELKESVLEKLSMFPRCSTTCLLRVE